jgi:hypothetical protein
MNIEISTKTVFRLKKLFKILEHAADNHKVCVDEETLIDPWTPSGDPDNNEIYCPELTVGLLREAKELKSILKL